MNTLNEQIIQPLDVGTTRSIAVPDWFSKVTDYPMRTNTRIEPLVCGEETFGAIATALKGATKSINMAFWGLDPGMVLVRSSNGNYNKNDVLSEILLQKATQENVFVRTANWDPFVNTQFLSLTEQGNWGRYEDATKLHENMLHVQLPHFSTYTKTGSYHQKHIIIDIEDPENATAFIMGHNMLGAYWDTEELLPSNTQRDFRLRIDRLSGQQGMYGPQATDSLYTKFENNSGPYIDVSCQIWGGGVTDVYHNFERTLKLAEHTISPEHSSLNLSDFATSVQSRALGSQVAATFPKATPPETKIRDQYLNAITKANKYVFMLNQYFRDEELTDDILKALKKRNIPDQKRLPIIFVTNTFENAFLQEGHDTAILQKFKDAGIPVSLARMVTPQAQTRTDITVHAKVLVVDDVFYSIGSANYNHRSMNADPELNIGALDPSNAESLRKELLRIIIGSPMDKLIEVSGYANLEEAGYNDWLEFLKENDDLFDKESDLENGRAITYTPTGWRGLLPTRFAQADPPSGVTSYA